MLWFRICDSVAWICEAGLMVVVVNFEACSAAVQGLRFRV